MTRGWINAIADGQPFKPSLEDGAIVQRITDAAALERAHRPLGLAGRDRVRAWR